MGVDGSSLEQRFHSHVSSLWILRLALAGTVAVAHAQELGWGDQPKLGDTQLGNLAVDGFFLISGFLVTRSAVRLGSFRRFAWHRALRILPGFWTCLAMTAFVATPIIVWLQGASLKSVFSAPDSAPGFVTRNAFLMIRQWTIGADVVQVNHAVMNGSLWTLFYEAVCYVAAGLLVTAGLIRHRRGRMATRPQPAHRAASTQRRAWRQALHRHALLVLLAAVWVIYLVKAVGLLTVGPDYLPRFLLLFLIGSAGHVYAPRIAISTPFTLAALGAFTVSLAAFHDYRPLGALPFGYLVARIMVAFPVRWTPRVDLSYGLYLYHWPVELVLTQSGAVAIGRLGYTVAAIGLALAMALASWHVIEAPALRHKDAAWIGNPTWRTTAPPRSIL